MQEVRVPASVSQEHRQTYVENYSRITKGTDRLFLFAGDQKIEHLNADFYGEGIHIDDADPEHLFRIAKQGDVGVFAAQHGLISAYARDYPNVPYLVKMNSRSPLVKHVDPVSTQLVDFYHVLSLRKNGVPVTGIGYTIYLGSEFENIMFAEAGRLIADAHRHGMVAIIWLYPRGKAVSNEHTPEIISGACGVAASLGADFVKVIPPNNPQGHPDASLLSIAARAAGRTGVITSGGSRVSREEYLSRTAEQLSYGTRGLAAGRNVHQHSLSEAVKLCKAINALLIEGKSVEEAQQMMR